MRKIICIAAALVMFLSSGAYALYTTLFEIRGKIFDESRAIKLLLPNARKDIVFMNSLWDSCIITIDQLDAYFSMLGIFNTIKKDAVTESAVDYIYGWLNMMKSNNDRNIKNLGAIGALAAEANTKLHVKKMADYYTDLNGTIAAELIKVSALKATSKKDSPPAKGR